MPLNERGYLLNMSRLTDALDERFDDLDEVKDVANHGCAAGVGGFIYYNETREFFLKYEAEIEETLEALMGDDWLEVLAKRSDRGAGTSATDITTLINKMVWAVVEDYCQSKSLIEAA